MNKNIKFLMIGVFALAFAVGLNLKHAADDYGITKNNLRIEVLACGDDTGSNCGAVVTGYTINYKPNTKCHVCEVFSTGRCSVSAQCCESWGNCP